VHDLLALRSALGDVPENPTAWSGKTYQRYIRNGFQQAKHFISISNKTREDLHLFGKVTAATSDVVYNGLNYPYSPMPTKVALKALALADLPAKPEGMLLHLGGSQWYKNLAGVIHIYIEYVKKSAMPLPLWCVSPSPCKKVQQLLKQVPQRGQVFFIHGIENITLQATYSLARIFIFPSLAEGFGWPIIEAQACGCPVITTDASPMNEIGGSAASYVPVLKTSDDAQTWALLGAEKLLSLLAMPALEREQLVTEGIVNAARFNADGAIEAYLDIYRQVLFKSPVEPIQKHKSIFSRKIS
jgi:glycosyltransferase involved in cell wall biosynthesis